jgi:nicotinate (nicotinamide) nucleotide adenylyltransferase
LRTITSLGILGGTFDPVHYGHLVAAECARDAFHLDRVLFMPAARPPHKNLSGVLDSHHRYAMVDLAIRDNDDFEISAMELERQGISYTVETVAACHRIYPGAEIYFILGTDALLLISTWKDLERLLQLCHFVLVTRPGYQLDRKDGRFRGVPALLWEKTLVLPIPGLFTSSSEIRRRVVEGRTIKYLVPAAVEQYISKNDLYRDGDGD